MWWRVAQVGMAQGDLGQHCKRLIRTSPFFKRLFQHYGVDPKDSWKLRIRTAPLDEAFAEVHGDDLTLDTDAISRLGVARCMHLVAHEMVHWLKGQKRQEEYFADPEEVEGFNWGIAHELSSGKGWDEIENTFLPLIQIHLKDPAKAKHFLIERFKDARRLLKS